MSEDISEVEIKEEPVEEPKPSTSKLKPILIAFFAFFLVILLTVVGSLAFYLKTFSKSVGISSKELTSSLSAGLKNPFGNDYLTFLLLGLDQRSEDDSLLTDTILLININTKTGNYTLFSIPRDLWLDDLKTKINALYYYGKKQDPSDGTKMVEEKLENILSCQIDHTILLQMEDIKKLIDNLGGVEIDVERSFVDTQFPKDDDSHGTMTVEFEKGKQVFDGEKALTFMRSRKSEDPIEGTDQARQIRQKKVILAIKNKLISSRLSLLGPKTSGNLLKFFLEEIETVPQITVERMVSFYPFALKVLYGEQTEIEIPWQQEEEDKILFVGKDPVYGTWILEPRGNSWTELSDFYHQRLPK